MEPSVQHLWDKSLENRKVCRLAQGGRHFNAAASRYYYAMRLATHALFKTKRIEGRWVSESGVRIEHWDHKPMIDKAHDRFDDELGLGNCLETAKGFREKADYEPYPVDGSRLQTFVRMSEGVFRGILNEIRKS